MNTIEELKNSKVQELNRSGSDRIKVDILLNAIDSAYEIGKSDGVKEQKRWIIEKLNSMQTHIETFIVENEIDGYLLTAKSAKTDLEYFLQIKEAILKDSTPTQEEEQQIRGEK